MDFYFDFYVYWSGLNGFMGEFVIGSFDEKLLGVWFLFIDW